MSESNQLATQRTPAPKLARPKKAKKLGNGADHASASFQSAQPPNKTLAQVAVATAAGEVQQAKQVYLEAKQKGVREFFDFVRQEQSATAQQIEDQVLGFYGLDYSDVYELPAEA